MLWRPAQLVYINSIPGANCLWGESSLGRDAHGAKRLWSEMSFHGAKCPWGEKSINHMGRRKVFELTVLLGELKKLLQNTSRKP